MQPGSESMDDFVGWTGLVPISILFENIFGIQSHVSENQLVWDIRLLERHGIKNYPFGQNIILDLECNARKDPHEEVQVNIESTHSITVKIEWLDGEKELKVKPN